MQFYFEVSKTIEAGLVGDISKVRTYAKRLSEKLKASDDEQASLGIDQLLISSTSVGMDHSSLVAQKVASSSRQKEYSARSEKIESRFSRPVPVEKDNRFSLADKNVFEKGSIKLFVKDEQKSVMNLLIKTVQKREKLFEFRLPVNASLLLHGRPGTGKTMMASLIASELGLPLITARSDALISSYLGSTSKNIRSLLEYAQEEPCVLFLDEFDAIAKARDDKNEVGELKRVVVSLLQNIDNLGDTVLIAATNHPHLLDPAIWRRFHYKMELREPDKKVRETLFLSLLELFQVNKKDIQLLVKFSEGLTGAEIEMSVNGYLRSIILDDEKFDVFGLVRDLLMHRYGWLRFDAADRNTSIYKLRKENKSLFTQNVLGSIFGMSDSNVRKILRSTDSG